MAATWRATKQGVAYASAKSMLDVFNGGSSARVIRCYRMYLFNNGLSAVTGILTTMRVNRTTEASAGSTVTPVKHDSNSSALDANTTCGTNRTITRPEVFRQIVWSNDEPTVSGSTQDEWECLVPFAEIWNAGYGDSNVEPIVCRAGYGAEIQQAGASAVGSADLEIEFTDDAT